MVRNTKIIRRGGIYPAHGTLRRRMTPRADASIVPYRGLWCDKAVISRLAAVPAAGRRGGFHIRPGFLRQREARRDEGIPPYVCPDGEDQPF